MIEGMNGDDRLTAQDADLQAALQPYGPIFFAIAQSLNHVLKDRTVTIKLDKIKVLAPWMPAEAIGTPMIEIGIHHPGDEPRG